MPHQLSTQSHKSIFKFPTNFGKYRKMIEYHIVTIVTIILVKKKYYNIAQKIRYYQEKYISSYSSQDVFNT